MRVIVDDNIKGVDGAGGTAGNALKYPVYLMAEGALAEGVQQELRIEADRNILSKQDVISVDIPLRLSRLTAPTTVALTILPTPFLRLLVPGPTSTATSVTSTSCVFT
jgi:hypothetical protein